MKKKFDMRIRDHAITHAIIPFQLSGMLFEITLLKLTWLSSNFLGRWTKNAITRDCIFTLARFRERVARKRRVRACCQSISHASSGLSLRLRASVRLCAHIHSNEIFQKSPTSSRLLDIMQKPRLDGPVDLRK